MNRLSRIFSALVSSRLELLACIDRRDDLIDNLRSALALAEHDRDDARHDADLLWRVLEGAPRD